MKKWMLVFLAVFSLNTFGHADHSTPGAIPPAPHGGQLGEAKHKHKGSHDHDHKKASEREIFFEILQKGKTLEVFPYELDSKDYKSFIELSTEQFSDTKIELFDPRKKKKFKPELRAGKKSWTLSLEKVKARRVFTKIKTFLDGGKFRAKIQVELKR